MSTTIIILKYERLYTFPLLSRTSQECPSSSILFNMVPELLKISVSQGKEIKVIQIRKKNKNSG